MGSNVTRNPIVPSLTPGQATDSTFFDSETYAKITQLEMDKALAVQNENYDLAKHLKDQIDRMRAVGV